MNDARLSELIERVNAFRDERNWRQFHNPKDVALSLTLEVAELIEHMQWRNGEELAEHLKSHQSEVADELADVFCWVLILAHDLQIDLGEALKQKLVKNAEKYPADKARGSARKYTEYREEGE